MTASASQKKYLNSLTIRDLHKNGRHYKFALWVVVQCLVDLPPDQRKSLDVIALFKVPDRPIQKKFFDLLVDGVEEELFGHILETSQTNMAV